MTDTYEVELKVRASHDAVRERLAASEATREAVVTQTDTYYNAPDRDFAETDEALRIRTETVTEPESAERTELTYKGPLVDDETKTRIEAETTVGDPDAARSILDGLGYDPAATVEKHRERYRLDGVTVTLDDVTDLGTFVEVEREATAADVDAAREAAKRTLRDLGLDPDDGIRTSYLGLLLADDE